MDKLTRSKALRNFRKHWRELAKYESMYPPACADPQEIKIEIWKRLFKEPALSHACWLCTYGKDKPCIINWGKRMEKDAQSCWNECAMGLYHFWCKAIYKNNFEEGSRLAMEISKLPARRLR